MVHLWINHVPLCGNICPTRKTYCNMPGRFAIIHSGQLGNTAGIFIADATSWSSLLHRLYLGCLNSKYRLSLNYSPPGTCHGAILQCQGWYLRGIGSGLRNARLYRVSDPVSDPVNPTLPGQIPGQLPGGTEGFTGSDTGSETR